MPHCIGGAQNTGFSVPAFTTPSVMGRVNPGNGGAGNNATATSGLETGTVAIYSTAASGTGSTLDLYINGASSATTSVTITPGTPAPNEYILCALSNGAAPTFPLAGVAYEFIVYDTVLTTAQRLMVHRYLGARYGITVL